MKKEKKLIIIIIMLCVLLFGCVGYIVFDKLTNKEEVVDTDKVENENKEEKEETRNLSSVEEKKLYDMILDYNRILSYYYPIDDMSKVSNADLFLFGLKGVDYPTSNSFSAGLLDEVINKYFEDSIKLKHEDYFCSVDNKVIYKYDENAKIYSFSSEGHGHGGSTRAFISQYGIKIVGGEYNNDVYTLNAKVFYGNACSDVCGLSSKYYKSYADSLSNTNLIVDTGDQELTDSIMEQYKDAVPTTIYKFKMNSSDNIVLTSVEVK